MNRTIALAFAVWATLASVNDAFAGPLVDDHSINNSAAAASAANASNVNAPVTVNTNTATGGNASASNANANTATGGSVRDSGNSSNRNTNLQGQLQGQGQGQSQTITNPRQPVSSAQATALTAAPETCMGSSSIGGQGVGFGLSFGTTWTDDACQARMDARELARLGYADAARARLCQSEGVRMAFEATGQSCAAATPAPAPAPVGGTSEPMQPIE